MFDLKEKLLKAGLVTEGQVEKVKEEEKRQKPNALKKATARQRETAQGQKTSGQAGWPKAQKATSRTFL